jgi:hypothetical protein
MEDFWDHLLHRFNTRINDKIDLKMDRYFSTVFLIWYYGEWIFLGIDYNVACFVEMFLFFVGFLFNGKNAKRALISGNRVQIKYVNSWEFLDC